MALDLDFSELVSLNVVVDDETAPPEEAPLAAEAERLTLGCTCDPPTPRGPKSALCADCGLVYMTSAEYSAFLAERRSAVERALTHVPTPHADSGSTPSEPEPAAAGHQDPAPRRRLLRRRRR